MSEETGTPFKIGDHVKLRSDGPVMTVEEVVSGHKLLICVWWQKDGYQRAKFDPAVLVAVT